MFSRQARGHKRKTVHHRHNLGLAGVVAGLDCCRRLAVWRRLKCVPHISASSATEDDKENEKNAEDGIDPTDNDEGGMPTVLEHESGYISLQGVFVTKPHAFRVATREQQFLAAKGISNRGPKSSLTPLLDPTWGIAQPGKQAHSLAGFLPQKVIT